MTAREAVEAFRDACPADLTDDVLVSWISEVEGMIYCEIIQTHRGGDKKEFDFITLTHGYDDKLFATGPHARIYCNYLRMMRDAYYSDGKRFEVSSELFFAAYDEYADWYNRTHEPIQRAKAIRVPGGAV